MQELRLVGVQEDGGHLLLSNEDGEEFSLPVTDALRAAATRPIGRPSARAADAAEGVVTLNLDRWARNLTVQEVSLATVWDLGGSVFTLDRGEVVRSWPMRGTLHLTAAEDLPWMLDLLGERALAGVAKRRASLGLSDDDVARACDAAVAALSGGRRLSRAGLLAAIEADGVAVTVDSPR